MVEFVLDDFQRVKYSGEVMGCFQSSIIEVDMATQRIRIMKNIHGKILLEQISRDDRYDQKNETIQKQEIDL